MTIEFKIAILLFIAAIGSFIGGHIFALYGSPSPRVTNWADVCAVICGIVFMICLILVFSMLIYAVAVS